MSSNEYLGVPPEITQLDCINKFKYKYNLVTGFVDHTSKKEMPALAVAKGASIVTKHISPEKNWRGPDWSVCLDPDTLKESRDLLKYAAKTIGASKDLSQAEFNDRSIHRRSLYTRNNLKKNQIIKKNDLIALTNWLDWSFNYFRL